MTKRDPQREMLGDYELLTRLTSGGMAEIFLARQTGIGGLERLVVIKRVLPEHAEDENFTEMFLREARIVARINDPNVVQIFELGAEQGDYFLSMEYIHGLTIAELIDSAAKSGSWFPLGVSISVIEQACKGLNQVHEVRDLEGKRMGLIHRDVSHQNFMCNEEGFVKLIDFGIAKSTESAQEATYSGAVKGKYAYMSPEQCSRDELDRRTDIFSIGVVAWEIFAGKRLFKRGDKLETVKAITQEEIPPPSSNNPNLPDRIDRVVMRALEKDPNSRYQTAEEFRSALLEAGRALNLEVGPDKVADYVKGVAGAVLEERRDELRQAIDQSTKTGESPRDMDLGGLRTPGPGTQKGSSTTEQVQRALPVAIVVGTLALLAAVGWYVYTSGGDSAASTTRTEPIGPTLTIGWPPIVEGSVIEKETAPVWRYVEDQLDRPVELTFTSTYGALSEKLRSGELDYAMLPPLLYVKTKEKAPDIEPLVVRQFDGAVSIDGVLLVAADSKIRRIADLKGERICLTDRKSTTGNFLPRAYLRRQGFDPDSFLGPVQWSGSHVKVLRDLLARRCAVAATSSASLLTAGEFGISAGQLRQLAVTGHVPQDTLVASPDAPKKEAAQLKQILLDFDPQTVVGKPRVSDMMKITGFSELPDGAHDELREAISQSSAKK